MLLTSATDRFSKLAARWGSDWSEVGGSGSGGDLSREGLRLDRGEAARLSPGDDMRGEGGAPPDDDA